MSSPPPPARRTLLNRRNAIFVSANDAKAFRERIVNSLSFAQELETATKMQSDFADDLEILGSTSNTRSNSSSGVRSSLRPECKGRNDGKIDG
ncbi:hypothetical protein AAMO2058_001137700 [Amorphochlora amoebiformis]|mmetsp:Transcript_21761/g.34378  ORF Transcript_21761/g.34378 Transcript_21761/m.34378 type:complete len:93 (-) Transcript_21761:255-533(-)